MDERPLDLALLRTFSPLDGLKKENLHALARKTQIRELDSGRLLFKEGDTDQRSYFLVSGTVELRADDRVVATVRAGTPEARTALAPGLPRRYSARAVGDLRYVMFDSDQLDVLLTWDQTGQYEVAELRRDGLDTSGDWMTTLLQTKAFHRIPPANIQAIFMRMQRVNYRAGDVVIKQGTEGDYFYVVVAGKCVVTRETPLNKEGIRLAELGPGDSFGEAGQRVVIEEGLTGPECSLLVLCDGQRLAPLAPAQDFKRRDDDGAGPNTGGWARTRRSRRSPTPSSTSWWPRPAPRWSGPCAPAASTTAASSTPG